MELQRLGVKLFVENPSSLEIRSFIPIFHSWIQRQAIEGHLLIDIHDYSHVYRGPGILLVAHEGNFSMDRAEDRLGLFYCQKQPSKGSLRNHIQTIFRTALQACRLLEEESELEGIRFKTDEVLVVANDRLFAPNTPETFQQLQPVFREFFEQLFDGNEFTLNHRTDPKERFSVTVHSPHSMDTQTLLERAQRA
ncbi:MAG: hypothetical protein IH937_08565 [Acidobacteria bacterium]|nr:hypothetical protein [Acidobacteriota bacterium]